VSDCSWTFLQPSECRLARYTPAHRWCVGRDGSEASSRRSGQGTTGLPPPPIRSTPFLLPVCLQLAPATAPKPNKKGPLRRDLSSAGTKARGSGCSQSVPRRERQRSVSDATLRVRTSDGHADSTRQGTGAGQISAARHSQQTRPHRTGPHGMEDGQQIARDIASWRRRFICPGVRQRAPEGRRAPLPPACNGRSGGSRQVDGGTRHTVTHERRGRPGQKRGRSGCARRISPQ
jgi:hypothetical protein